MHPRRACDRCRSRHQSCRFAAASKICQNCLEANSSCNFRKSSEWRFRFANVCVPSRERGRLRKRVATREASMDNGDPLPVIRSSSYQDALCQETDDLVPSSPKSTDNRSPGSSASQPPNPHASSPVSPQPALHDSLSETLAGQQDWLLGARPRNQQDPPEGLLSETPGPHLRSLLLDPSSTLRPGTTTASAPLASHSPETEFGPVVTNSVPPHTDEQDCFLSHDEARLVKHFLTVQMSWVDQLQSFLPRAPTNVQKFDFGDPGRHFYELVRAMILGDAVVRYAVLAVASRHLEQLTQTSAQLSSCPDTWSQAINSYEYERCCLELLIPSLNEKHGLHDGMIATAILLRTLNEMTEPPEGEIVSSHSISTSVLMRIKQGDGWASPFCEACMIIALRQEIFVSNMIRRPIASIESYIDTKQSLEPAPDVVWTRRIIAHAARATNFIHEGKDLALWDSLWNYLQAWDENYPATLKPLNILRLHQSGPSQTQVEAGKETDKDEATPSVYCTSDSSAAAQQYFQLCRMLLVAYNPRLPVLGLGSGESVRERDSQIRDAVRIISGIAEGNMEMQPTRSVANVAIALSGEFFSDRCETEKLLCLVKLAEQHLRWPCFKFSGKLQEIWGL